jgi:triosephosphate isomerase
MVDVLAERKAQGKKQITFALAVPATDIYTIASLGLVPVLAEHLDKEAEGATTGHVIAESLLANGAVGTLLNHSEDSYTTENLAAAVSRAKKMGLCTIVCAPNAKKAFDYAHLQPDFIAMEPPELIGGDISVSTAQPSLILDTVISVRQVAEIPVLVGAGVKTTADVHTGANLGAVGILVASSVTKAANIPRALRELAAGFD